MKQNPVWAQGFLSVVLVCTLSGACAQPGAGAAPNGNQLSTGGSRGLVEPPQDWLRRRARIVDDWMARYADRSEWVVGWWHDYVNPDGSHLAWRPDNPPAHARASEAERKQHGGWTFMFRSRHIEAVRDAAWLYRATGDERYAHWAASQLTFYAAHYTQWPLQRRLGMSRLMGQSLDEANVIIHLAEAARAVRPLASPAEQALWRSGLFMPVSDTLRQSVTGLNNISVWQRSALGVVALLLDDAAMWQDAVEGPTGFKALIDQGLTRDGVWYEGSFGYNAYVIRASLPLLRAAAEAGRSAELDAAAQRLRMALTTPLTLRFDDGTLPNPSDSTSVLKAPDLPLLAEARTLLPTPWGDAAATRHPSWAELGAPLPAGAEVLPALPTVRSTLLPDTSMGVLKDGASGWQVFAHWGQRTQHHAQREALNLEMHWRGQPLSRDPGTVLYGSPMHASYYTQPAAHNVPFVDDKGQQDWAPGTVLGFDADGPRLAVSQPRYTAGVGVDRTTALVGGDMRDSVQFRPEPGGQPPRSMGLTWHFDCRLNVNEPLPPSLGAKLPAGEGFAHWAQVHAYRANGEVALTLLCPSGALRLTIEVGGPYELFTASAPNLPAGTSRDAIYLRAPFAPTGFRSTFSPLRDPPSPAAQP